MKLAAVLAAIAILLTLDPEGVVAAVAVFAIVGAIAYAIERGR